MNLYHYRPAADQACFEAMPLLFSVMTDHGGGGGATWRIGQFSESFADVSSHDKQPQQPLYIHHIIMYIYGGKNHPSTNIYADWGDLHKWGVYYYGLDPLCD